MTIASAWVSPVLNPRIDPLPREYPYMPRLSTFRALTTPLVVFLFVSFALGDPGLQPDQPKAQDQSSPLVRAEWTDQLHDMDPATLAGACEPHWTPDLFPGPSAVNRTVFALTVFDDGSGSGPALYAGGDITTAGMVSVGRIAKWDGSSWSALGTGMGGDIQPTVVALTVFDDGSGGGPALYAGGRFTTAGGVTVNRIAKWNGSLWSALGSGMDGTVLALTVYDDGSGDGPALYAGGAFTTAGGVTANRIAKWDGTSWSALGTGMNNTVSTLTVFDDGSGNGPALYAGGSFTTAGGVTVNRIAKWDGTSWSPLGDGMNSLVEALTVFDDGSGSGPSLYAGGGFSSAGGVTANRIARWDGSSWSALSAGMNTWVLALVVYDDGSGFGPALYAGGEFTEVGGVPGASRIAKWDGSSWSALGTGMSGVPTSSVLDLIVYNDGSGSGPALCAGGSFTIAGDVETGRIAKWDGSSWSVLGREVNGLVSALNVFDDNAGSDSTLYVGGTFTTAGGKGASRIAKWDGSSWSTLGSGVKGGSRPEVSALTVFDDDSGSGPVLIAGGQFTYAGGVAANNIARWDGFSWSALGTGMNHDVRALTVFDDGSGSGPALYAGGLFTIAGGVKANYIAKWNGSSWSALGEGMNYDVYAFTVFDDGNGGGPALYAGGFFTTAGAVTVNRVARWDGSSWSALGTGISGGFQTRVRALTVFDDGSGSGPALYAGGEFTTAGDETVNRIAKWTGSLWSALGAGMTNRINGLTVFDDGSGNGPALYAGGAFNAAGGAAANGIAKWNGSSWSALGSGMNGEVAALTIFNDGLSNAPVLYAGGNFTTAGGVLSSRMARWEGCSLASEPCPGDANNDDVIDHDDFAAVIANWSAMYSPGTGPGDANADGFVDFDDITTVLANWGVSCP